MPYASISVIRALLVALAVAAQLNASDAAVPREAVTAIIEAFHTRTIVALPDAHGGEKAHAFLLSLIRDPRFAETVNDIVVEFGSARYQDVVDRFVRGEDVLYETLRRAWQDTTQPSAANDRPHAEAVFRAVRAVNAGRPRDRQLRVLLGDPPIAWERIQTRAEHFKWIEMRDMYPAALIQLEVIAKQRRALVVYGVGHLQRKNVHSNFQMDTWPAQTIVSLIERASPTPVFTIIGIDATDKVTAHQPGIAAWKVPSLATIRGTALGAADAAEYFSWGTRFAIRDGKMVPVPREEWRTLRAEDQFDAVLYLGAEPGAEAPWSPALCADSAYLDMRFKRIALAGLPPKETERLNSSALPSRSPADPRPTINSHGDYNRPTLARAARRDHEMAGRPVADRAR